MNAIAQYFDETLVAAERAAESTGVITRDIVVVEQRIKLCCVGEALFGALWPALAHLEVAGSQLDPEFTFYLWDGRASNVFPESPPLQPEQYHRYGGRAIVDTPEFAVLHSPMSSEISVYCRSARIGLYFVHSAAYLSIYEKAAPLQTLLHWALSALGWHIVHAAAVGAGERGVLLVGGAGSGKSTTALACLHEPGMRFLSDDKCLVRLDGTLLAFGIYCAAKLKHDAVAMLPAYGKQIVEWHGDEGQGKGLTYLYPTEREHLVKQFQVEALMLPKVTHQREASIQLTQANAIFRALGPSTVIWMPGSEAENYRFMAEIARQIPCYHLDLASDLPANARAIQRFLDER